MVTNRGRKEMGWKQYCDDSIFLYSFDHLKFKHLKAK